MDRPRDPLPTRVDLCPPLPPAYADALDPALAALGIELASQARAVLDGHVRLLLAWNAAINLTAIREPAAIAVRHVADSLTGIRPLRERGIDRFVDLGSGGGFPGLPLAAALPADRALLVDSIGKKVRFLAAAIDALGLSERVAAESVRAEALAAGHDRGQWPAVTARAVAPLPELVEVGLPLLRPGGVLVAWKRSDSEGTAGGSDAAAPREERAAAERALTAIDPGARLTVEPALPAGGQAAATAELRSHVLVIVTRGPDPIAAGWPRDPAARGRQPW